MSSEAITPRLSTETPSRETPRDEAAGNRLIRANIWVAVIAFGVAAAMAMMQAISRANLELPYRSASMYYMSVTAHGILMALVFTTFFIMGLGWAIAQKEIGTVPWRRAG
jgi:cytochrome c oxidase subunit 1